MSLCEPVSAALPVPGSGVVGGSGVVRALYAAVVVDAVDGAWLVVDVVPLEFCDFGRFRLPVNLDAGRFSSDVELTAFTDDLRVI